MKNRKKIYVVAVIILLLDQLTKLIIQRSMNLYQEIKLIPNFFSLCYVKNTGAAFSILEDATLLLILISIIFVLIIDKYIKKENETFHVLTMIAFGMIIGGIFGNLLDRILYRSVIDFLSFQFGNYFFPIFNIADIGITIGTLLLLVDTWERRKEE